MKVKRKNRRCLRHVASKARSIYENTNVKDEKEDLRIKVIYQGLKVLKKNTNAQHELLRSKMKKQARILFIRLMDNYHEEGCKPA